jgi:Zn-dependent peptidase ImmA (M78 family)
MPADYRQLVDELLDMAGLKQVPVDVERLAGRLGVRVAARSDLPPKVSGFLYRGPLQDVIIVNAWHRPVRRRFTVAHELGHWALDEQGIFHEQGGHGGAPDTERAMDAFASVLLMPEDLMYRELGRCARVVDLAARFRVSQGAMVRRLAELRAEIDEPAADERSAEPGWDGERCTVWQVPVRGALHRVTVNVFSDAHALLLDSLGSVLENYLPGSDVQEGGTTWYEDFAG